MSFLTSVTEAVLNAMKMQNEELKAELERARQNESELQGTHHCPKTEDLSYNMAF